MNHHEHFMRRCLELASKGIGDVAPNPMVGAVIVHNDIIIGEGYHEKYGSHHAEVNAVNSVKDKSLLKEATIYVSLEPCAHFGKTPPCADLIVHHSFKKVIIGCQDPFSEVSGKGIERIKKAGIEVVVGVLEKESLELNKRFFTYHLKKRPYIILKWATSADGFLDKERSSDEKGINWITQAETQTLVHKWRSQEMAILVGKKTAMNDNPSLTVRKWKGKNPIRVLLDSNLEVKSSCALFNDQAPTLVVNTQKDGIQNNIKWVNANSHSMDDLLAVLYKEGIISIIIEGGHDILQFFIDNNMWDEARVLTGIPEFKTGLKAPIIKRKPITVFPYGRDMIQIFANS